MEIDVSDAPAKSCAAWMAGRLRGVATREGSATLAVSGGDTAPPLFEALITHDLPWERLTVWQVDERVVPDGHPERNAEQLSVLPCRVRAMPVTSKDLRAAARRYGASLPERFDVVHLGLGDDGHTASWPPDDHEPEGRPRDRPVVRSERPVEVIGEFNGFRRMTLTPMVVNAAATRVMLTLGASKAPLLRRWLVGDRSLPVAHVVRGATWCFVDEPAAP